MTEVTIRHRNELTIIGRVTAPGAVRELPSGDVVTTCRVTVDRGDGRHDVFTCTAWTAKLQRAVSAWHAGDVVEIGGAMRRRFWRPAGGAPASAYDVEVARAKRLSVTRPRTRG